MKKFDIIGFPCAALYEFSIKRLNHGLSRPSMASAALGLLPSEEHEEEP
jgi:hypothetical protein